MAAWADRSGRMMVPAGKELSARYAAKGSHETTHPHGRPQRGPPRRGLHNKVTEVDC